MLMESLETRKVYESILDYSIELREDQEFLHAKELQMDLREMQRAGAIFKELLDKYEVRHIGFPTYVVLL